MKKTTKKKTTKSVKMNENEHCRMMKVNAMNLAKEIAAKHMAELSRRMDEIRKKYKPNYPANVDQLVDEVQSTHNHMVAQCREEIANAGVCDYLSTEDISMTINESMWEVLSIDK